LQKKPNQKMQAWIEARKRYGLSHAQVQMARELGNSRMQQKPTVSNAGTPQSTPILWAEAPAKAKSKMGFAAKPLAVEITVELEGLAIETA
jgi:hypothetical protein